MSFIRRRFLMLLPLSLFIFSLNVFSQDIIPTSEEPIVSAPDGAILMDITEVLGTKIERNPAGRTIGKVEREKLESTDAFNLREMFTTVPGVTLRQSNGPRDVSISVRGSGAKQSFAVRNIKMYEDWFPTTQSDGLSRTDINDPNAYEGIDVIRGPSSSLYDNYALGGVVNFRSRRGRDIRGVDVGSTAGSHAYLNNYVHAGNRYQGFEYAVFGSFVRGSGYIDHSQFWTGTQNITMTFTPDSKRTIVFKYLNNDLRAQVPSRLTLDQLNQNPRQEGRTSVTGVGTISATQTDQNREDRRTIMGARYEYAATPNTGIRFLGAYDVKDINQTFGTIGDNVNPNFHQYADITHQGKLFGKEVKHFVGLFFNLMEQEANSFRNLGDFNGTRGALNSNTRGTHRNVGARFREEIQFDEKWTGILGVGLESSRVSAQVQTRTSSETYSRVSVGRNFFNVAPEVNVIYQATPKIKIHSRMGTGYGIPGMSQLTTTPSGVAGNNNQLKSQRNLGFELGTDGQVVGKLMFDVVGYYEFFYDELVSQSPGAGLSSYSTNAKRADHRGAEATLDFRTWSGISCSGSYTYNDHVYKNYTEIISGTSFNRANKKIPGVEKHVLNSRVGYESPIGLGAWVEANYIAPYYINNSNTLKAQSSTVWNLNTHFSKELTGPVFKKLILFFDLRNVFDRKYIGSTVVVADALTDTPANVGSTKQGFFAGQDRSFFSGIKLTF
ncbi:MAG: TonB-dependent receptor family protein [Elusimicrobiota bacterium]